MFQNLLKRLGRGLGRAHIPYMVICGQARDMEDVRCMVLKNPKYDTRYIVKWLKLLDRGTGTELVDAFRRVIRQQS